jgi:DNA-binding IclR family transcriptional regulator
MRDLLLKKSIGKKKSKEPTTEISGKDLRNLRAFELAASGMNQTEIGEEIGLTRQRVNTILNSEQAKEFVERARSRLLELQDTAVLTLQDAMDDRHNDMKTAVAAATTLLKGTGTLTDNIKVNDGKPFVIEFLDGTKVKMGFGEEKDS